MACAQSDLYDHTMRFNQSSHDSQHLWSQRHAFGRWLSDDRNNGSDDEWRDDSEQSPEEQMRSVKLSNGPSYNKQDRNPIENKMRKTETGGKMQYSSPRPILEKWGPTYLILHPDGTTYWAHRRTIGDRQMARKFDENYKGFGLNVDVYDLRDGQTKEYLLHFRGRPEEECHWAKENMLSPELRAAITYQGP